jgi:hypothetical protein
VRPRERGPAIFFHSSSAAGALLLLAREQLSRTLHQLLLPADYHHRMTKNAADSSDKRRYRHAPVIPALRRFRDQPSSHAAFGPVTLCSSRWPKSGTAAEDHRQTALAMHFPQNCSGRTRFGLEALALPGGGSTGMHRFQLFTTPGSASRSANACLAQPTQSSASRP